MMVPAMLCCILITISRLIAEPPLVKEAPRQTTPVRVRVGGSVQAFYTGPAQQWFNNGMYSLSQDQAADLEKVLSTHPEDICARGYLIAHRLGSEPRGLEHLLWMIENHPEWDGFLLSRADRAQGAYDRIRAAWYGQTRPDQGSGTVLHNAAVFFARTEPYYAEVLLKRAINMEPEVTFHVEGLGRLYGRAQFLSTNPLFAARAKSILLTSSNPLLVGGALSEEMSTMRGGDFLKSLTTRMTELTGNRDAYNALKDLPSRSGRYLHDQCDPMPLLRR